MKHFHSWFTRLSSGACCAALATACSSSGGSAASGGAAANGGASATGGATAGGTSSGGTSSGGAAGNSGKPTCGTSDWTTYGHDAQRTSASDGCVSGPLTFAWSYAPSGWSNSPVSVVISAVTNAGSIFVRFTSAYGPQLDGLSSDGKRTWTWAAPGGRDVMTQHWATYAGGVLMVADDGLFLVDAATGVNKVSINQYDDWGQNAADSQRFYINSDLNSPDGPGMYLGAYSFAGGVRWRRDVHKACDGISEKRGSLAVDGTTLFRAGVYTAGAPSPSGVASYTGSSGAAHWSQPCTPSSAISVGDGQVYLVDDNNGPELVARKQTDGTIAWTKPLTGTLSTQAPVLAAGLVIIATATDIEAYKASTGAPAWTASNLSAATKPATDDSGAFNNCPGKPVAWSTIPYTTLAAALGSNSLVVTASDGIHILSLSDGKDLWHGLPSSVTGPVHNPIIVDHTLYAVDLGAGSAGKLVAMTSP